MPYLVGLAKTKEMMMLGDWFDAHDALRLGLVNAVVAPEELMPHAVSLYFFMCTRSVKDRGGMNKFLMHGGKITIAKKRKSQDALCHAIYPRETLWLGPT